VQSVDFFTPVVDSPRLFGRIAAANALSDIYAVGARPLTAMNLVGFPRCLAQEILTEILLGGSEAMAEAGATLVGGHTVEDDEPKYGLSVTGLVDPTMMVSTVGACPGDHLYLTKPLGTGILATALKGEVLAEKDIPDAIAGMATLNRTACAAMLEIGVNACTDITGFALLGHALEMAEASDVSFELNGASLPAYPHSFEMAAIGLVPEGSYRNREFYRERVLNWEEIAPEMIDLLADPQTSGGLLMAVAPEKSAALEARLQQTGGGWKVGVVKDGKPGTMQLT